ncbi:Ger(x)C family spore germination protein [Alteribacillus bidgolensis]|uniref:Spore germination protein n=1 Tax=Alteribacillus bidgolensis TaxID=930129 RepID=A0A1G8ED49_9BACI|nr:Ger(x)C family spore germination protein [Alteribacillus bidgolensis]SDH67833.1 spore germination protein [Alteribacillus bidgolensis]
MGKVLFYLIFFGVLPLFLAGCWDRVEIEDRGFLVGVAIDLKDETDEESEEMGGEYRYKGTYQIVVPAFMSQGSSDQSGGGKEKAYKNMSFKGVSMVEQELNLALELSRIPFYNHLQSIIISENVAKAPQAFGNVLDPYIREGMVRRGVTVIIAEDEAGPVLDFEPVPENLPIMYIGSVNKNMYQNPKMIPEKRLGDIHEHLVKKASFVVPKIKKEGQKINMTGAAVFHGHNNQMVDFINSDITEGLNFITGKYEGGVLKTKVKDDLIVYEIKEEKSAVKVDVKNKENIQFEIKIKTEGKIGESFSRLDYSNPKIESEAEDAVEKEIERKVTETIKTFQEDLKVDALGLGSYLEREDYRTWEKVKQDWDYGKNYFSNSTIKVQAEANIRDSGSVIKSEKQ